MPIRQILDPNQKPAILSSSELPIVLHGPANADITFICHGQGSAAVIEAADFLCTDKLQANVLQINTVDPLPADQLAALIRTSRHTLLIELDVEKDLYKLLQERTGIKLMHTHYFNPKHPRIQAKLVSLAQQLFTI